jgi:hypothetical protein
MANSIVRPLIYAIIGLVATVRAQDATFALRLFSPSVGSAFGANCLDGSAAGYYFSPGASDSYVIFMEGGGACWSNSGPFSCWTRYNTSLGSSKNWPETYTQNNNFFWRNCSGNPLFCNATYAYVPYCTGDVHAGM